MLVTLVGFDIMKGRSLLMPTSASDYAHLLVACLFHDIGYVRGILPGDDEAGYVIDSKGGKVKLARGASDAALTPYHVDRSKLFAIDRLAKMDLIDAARVAHAIEYTRFPVSTTPDDQDGEEGSLVRAADLIGQLGDPHFLRKANALYYEFEEVGMNRQLGYHSPADLTDFILNLLQQRFALYSDGNPIPECDVKRPAMDFDLVCQRLPRRTRA